MNKHPNKNKVEYKHSLATYPLEWKGYVVSPQKICIQFKDIQCKTRVKDRDTKDLIETEWNSWSMAVDSHGTGIDTLAVGIPLNLHPVVLTELLKAYKEHADKHPEDNLKEFLIDYAHKIMETFNGK